MSHSIEELFQPQCISPKKRTSSTMTIFWRILQKIQWKNQIKPYLLHWWNSWRQQSKGWKHNFIMAIKECDHPDAKVQKHNFIKSRFEREESLLGPYKLKDALMERKNYTMSKTPNQISTGPNLLKAATLCEITGSMWIQNSTMRLV